MLYQAKWVLPLDRPPLPGGWLKTEGDQIVAIGSEADLPKNAEVLNLPDCSLVAGFINAHCHLELTDFKNQLKRGLPFPTWVESLQALAKTMDLNRYLSSAQKGIEHLLAGGTTTVVDVGNTGAALSALGNSPLRSIGLIEVLGLDPASAAKNFEYARALALAVNPTSTKMQTGLSVHSAYACSSNLMAKTWDFQEHRGPKTFHAAESREESEFFERDSGLLREFCLRFYKDHPPHHQSTPFRFLNGEGLLPDRPLVVHANLVTAHDFQMLQRIDATIVHCPDSHAFFGHPPFPFSQFKARIIPVCLGTDSLASGDSLSMLDQMRLFQKRFPQNTAQEILRMVTRTAAQALGLGKQTGGLTIGLKADFIAIRTENFNNNPYEDILTPQASVQLSVIDGQEAWRASTF